MGDRCYMTIYVHKDDLAKFCPLIGESADDWPARDGMPFAEITVEEASYALGSEITEALDAKLRFHALNTAGDNYGHGATVCDGKKFAEVCTDPEGNPTVTVPVHQQELDNAIRYLDIVEAMRIEA
mgnify:CR=1 FL=1|tara:strand:- start:391 stop:768 length:378 start_codon:yes stop_codon:yes gene_type:complete